MNEDSQHSVATQLRELDTGPFSIDVLSDGSRGGTRGTSKIELDPFLAQSLDPPLVLAVFPLRIRHFFSVVRLRRYCNTIRLNRGL